MKTITRILAAALLITGISAACTDLGDLQQEVESLKSRVTALETLTENLNGNVAALQALVNGTTINSATQKDGVWTLVLSNGETITLTAGSVGVGNAPVMSVDKDGYWMVDYGKGAEYILMNGEKVKAVGTDGITPKFGVDKDGYWTVSYDGGATFTQVKDADGNPVSALPTGDVQDPYFADVKLENGVFTVTLRTGEVLTVPVVVDFLCAIESTGILTYNYGETKPYNVTMKGVASTMVTAPHGWKAALNENVLTVTAPAAPTKATLADSGSDVCILAFSTSGYATIAKVQVRLSDSPVAVVNPIASVTAGEATETTLTYNVALVDATSYKYIHQKEVETAPDAAKIAAEGTESTETALTLSNLESATAYVLYVLPINGEKQGAVAEGKNTTLEKTYSNNYERYMAGLDIEAGPITINKAKYGDATIITKDSENKTLEITGVYFIDSAAEGVQMKNAEKLLILSLDDKMATITKSGQTTVVPTSNEDYFIMHNIKYVTGMTSGNVFGGAKVTDVFETILFSKCQIEVPKDMSFMYAQLPIDNFMMVDCDIKIHATTNDKNFLATNTTTTYKSVIFRNNIIYCTDGDAANYKLFNNANATISDLELKNNTIAAAYAKDASGFIHVKGITKASIVSNLFYLPNYSTTNTKYSGIVWMPSGTDETNVAFKSNLAFYNYEKVPSPRMKCSFYRNDATGELYNKATADNPVPSPDYVNGVFAQGEKYTDFGAKR